MASQGTHAEDLKGRIEEIRRTLTQETDVAITAVREVATALNVSKTAEKLHVVSGRLRSDTFDLILVGRFKNGKSTLMNALLGKATSPVPELSNKLGPMPVDDLPCTATLTRIRYAERPTVTAWRFDGRSEPWSLERYLREATVRESEKETYEAFSEIREFEVGFPAELCKSGVTLIDSPGTDDVPARTDVTREAVDRCDAAIVVYRHDVFAGESERVFVNGELLGKKTRIFTIVNVFGDRVVDERLKGFAWNRLVGESGSGVRDLAAKDIYFVNAKMALDGKLRDDPALVEKSGLALVERRLGDFLANDRQRVHMERFARVADGHAAVLEQQIGQRRAALDADEQRLQVAYDAIQPKLREIERRRDRLPTIINRYREYCKREARNSFVEMVTRLREDLPGELAKRKLPTASGIKGAVLAVFQQDKIATEATSACTSIITDRVHVWTQPSPGSEGLPQALAPLFARMAEEISEEVAQMEQKFSEIHFEMTGWRPSISAKGEAVGWGQRVLAIAAGVVLHDIGLVLGGGAGGLRGAAGTVAGYIVGGLAVALLHLAAPIALPVMIAAGVAGGLGAGNHGVEERVKKLVLVQVLPQVQKLPQEAAGLLDAEIDRLFVPIEQGIRDEVAAAVGAEEENIRSMMNDNARGREEKATVRAQLDVLAATLTAQRRVFQKVVTNVQQI